jgi:hypothetical protein
VQTHAITSQIALTGSPRWNAATAAASAPTAVHKRKRKNPDIVEEG